MKRWTTELLLLGVVIVWGINYTLGKYGMLELSAIDFTAIRMVVAAPVLLLITWSIDRSLYIARRDFVRLFFVSMVGITFYQTLFMETITYISATNASLLISMSPIFTAIFSLLFKLERLSLQMLLGSVISFIGAALVLLANQPGVQHEHALLGTSLGLICSICWGLYPILANPLVHTYSALRVTAWSTVIGAVPLLLLSSSNLASLALSLHIPTWLSLGYSILFVTVFGLSTWYIGVQKIGPTNTMVYMYVTPLAAVLFAAFWGGEHVSLQQIIGGGIIFFGLWLVKRKKAAVSASLQEKQA